MVAQAPFDLEHTTHAGYDLVSLSGDLDITTAPRLRVLTRDRERLREPLLVVDLTAVDFLDSSGIGVLVGAERESQRAGFALALVVAPSFPGMSLLRMMRLDEVLTIHDTVAAAVAAQGC